MFEWRTLARVEAWLRAQPDGAVVGSAGSCSDCTLAKCYTALSALHVEMTPGEMLVERGSINFEQHATLPYEREFIDLHDEIGVMGNVTKEQALEFIELVREAA